MKRMVLTCLLTLALIGGAAAQTAGGGTPGANVALVATPSASYVSGDTSLAALNDGDHPRSSRTSPDHAYGNWNMRTTQWVQYDWDQPIHTDRIEIYWWNDGGGILFPSAYRILYWDGDAFRPVENADGYGIEADRFNVTTFDAVRTTRLRVEIDPGRESTGILEWRVIDAGDSPRFPPTVEAGTVRTVILGGHTYLTGRVRSLYDDATDVSWSKVSGPGEVTFENAAAAETTATFSAVGEYTLRLTAADGEHSRSDDVVVHVREMPTQKPLAAVPTLRYAVDSPLWNGRIKPLIVNWIPYCIDQMERTDLREGAGGIDNFINAARRNRGESDYEGHRGLVFSNAWVLQTVEAMCVALMIDPQGDTEIAAAQEKMRETLEAWIPHLVGAQEPDGYVHTAYTLGGWQRWDPRRHGDHEGYVAGYYIEMGVAHYIMTGGADRRLYDAAKKLADCWVRNIGPGPDQREWYTGHQELEMALFRLGRLVNEVEGAGAGDRYFELAKFLLDCRGGGSEYDQSHLPVVRQYEAVGHAVRAVYGYTGMTDVAMEMGDRDHLSATMSLWDSIVNRKYYITGGIGSGETSEGFGPDFSLRNNSYCESCSSAGLIFFQHRLNMLWRDARYADLYEETLYNAMLGTTDLEATVFNYTNPLHGHDNRTAWHVCPCCVGNIPRTLLMLPTWTYLKDDEGIFVNLFIGGTMTVPDVAGGDVELVQKTDYPWDGRVTITVNPGEARELTMRVRVPHRGRSAIYHTEPQVEGIRDLAVNGEAIEAPVENGYAVIRRTWRPGDTIAFEVPMAIQRVHADERVAADRGRVALRRGPIVYNVESVDQNVDGLLAPDAALSAEWRPDLLGGVVALKGTWADGSELLAIPNYARHNRQVGEREESGAFGGPGTLGSDDGAQGRRPRRGGQSALSIVWIREQ